MGFFDFFKKGIKIETTDNGIEGPIFLEGLTENISTPKNLKDYEWRRQLKAINGNFLFSIKYYGQLHTSLKNLIVKTDFAPPLIVALDIESGQEILLFDGCKHGYNAIFCDTFTENQIRDRQTDKIYKDNLGNTHFKIVISTYNSIDYDNEFSQDVDENGFIELDNGNKILFEDAKRNGFTSIQIKVLTEKGNSFEILSEELA
jgi:hypothetical protein